MTRNRICRRAGLLVLLGFAVALGVATTSLAVFTSTSRAEGGGISSGHWVYYLHNNPTPPRASTTAQTNLTATTSAPTATTLYNYDTNCDTRTGRLLQRSGTWTPSPATTTTCYFANWRMPALGTNLLLTRSVTVHLWVAVNNGGSNRTGGVVVYLRDYNPASGRYTEIASGTYSGQFAAGRTFYDRQIAVTLPADYTLAGTHQLELKAEAMAGLSYNMMLAYDTAANPSYISVR